MEGCFAGTSTRKYCSKVVSATFLLFRIISLKESTAVFVEFFAAIISLEYDINWPNFINRLCLLPKLFSKMYFLFYA